MRELALGALLLVTVACGSSGSSAPSAQVTSVPRVPAPAGPGPALPSGVGLNYDGPEAADGSWLGTRWLRPGAGGWDAARPRLQADLDFVAAHHLGRVMRVFVGIDQLMVWDPTTGFVRYDPAALDDLRQALDLFDAHHVTVIAVVFDQEEVGSPGNFRFQALDGSHPAMRAGYLAAVDQLFRAFGGRPTVAAWDLFNEAYNSLGTEGGLPRPPADDPVSPNYADATVHAWLRDLYRTAKRAAPGAWLTVSDTTELYWKDPPDVSKYRDAVDFYDIHVYDDHPGTRDWRRALDKPFLLGEVGGDPDHGLKDATVNARAVGFWLSHARPLGIMAVLVHSPDGVVYSLESRRVTPTGREVEAAQ